MTASTVSRLHSLRAPATLGTGRTSVERRLHRVLGRIVSARLGRDGGWVLTIADPVGRARITATFPAPACLGKAAPRRLRDQAVAARAALVNACGLAGRTGTVRLRGIADVTGVGFFGSRTSRLGLAPAVAVPGLSCRHG